LRSPDCASFCRLRCSRRSPSCGHGLYESGVARNSGQQIERAALGHPVCLIVDGRSDTG
jgi:hypothetical protein